MGSSDKVLLDTLFCFFFKGETIWYIFQKTFSPKSNVPPFYNDFIRHGRVSQLNPFLSGKWGKGKIEYSSRGKKVCPSFVFVFFSIFRLLLF